MALYVNGREIEEETIRAEIERLRPEYEKAAVGIDPKAQADQLYEWSKENIIERILLEQAVEKEQALSDDEVEKVYQELLEQNGGKEKFLKKTGVSVEVENNFKIDLAKRLQTEKLIQKVVSRIQEPTETDVTKYYGENPDKYTVPEMVRASHIVKHVRPNGNIEKIRQEMEDMHHDICRDSNFDEVAARHSDCPSNAGDLGYFPRGQMVQEFDDVVFNMEIEQISPVFHTQFGFHIAKLTDKKPAALCPLADIQEDVTKELTQELQQKELENFIDAEKSKAVIEEK